ncbi:hypothetical protein CRN75_10095 [Yersinia frederiksenii]|nr:hypothetical protein CRN75_10095 [Yersinia frederiksenii]
MVFASSFIGLRLYIMGESRNGRLNLLTSLCQHMLSGSPYEGTNLLNDVLKHHRKGFCRL